jgi:hypothetical protein
MEIRLIHGDILKLKSKDFPNNWVKPESSVLKKAMHKTLRLGVHTLSNFHYYDDPYVTPVPDKTTGKVGVSQTNRKY